MDPTLALVHADRPALVTTYAVVLPGTVSPTIIPLSALPPAVRAGWLIGDARAPLATRVSAALEVERVEDAWTLLRRRSAALDTDLALTRVLLAWQAHESARLALPAGRAELIELGAAKPPDDLRLAFGDVRRLLAALAWPRWLGPIVVVSGDDERCMPRSALFLARPVLPVIRLSPAAVQPQRRPEAAAVIARLALDLSAPPPAGWPEWLREGCAEVARAVARGEGPSPRAMLARRQQVGTAGLRALLTAPTPDPALAMALCAPLLHSKRRHLFANLLDPLRHGADSETALVIAYGLTIERLLTEQ